jgi:hypothetical protein
MHMHSLQHVPTPADQATRRRIACKLRLVKLELAPGSHVPVALQIPEGTLKVEHDSPQ